MTASDNNAEPTIRLATEDDIPTILQFIHDLASYEDSTHKVEATPTTLLHTLSFPSSPAKTAGTYTALITPPPTDSNPHPIPVGMALYFYNYSTWRAAPGVYLEDFYVEEKYRGCGYGRRLFEWLAREVKRVGGGRLEWSVLKDNYPSIKFYEKMGGVVGEEWMKMSVDREALDRLAEGKGGKE